MSKRNQSFSLPAVSNHCIIIATVNSEGATTAVLSCIINEGRVLNDYSIIGSVHADGTSIIPGSIVLKDALLDGDISILCQQL